jgi:GNAT superfamily N-acetyltransferase
MSLETIIEDYPIELELKKGFKCELRPLEQEDGDRFFHFFADIPAEERLFIKHRVEDPATTKHWCDSIDYLAKLPLLALHDDKIIGVATLHQQQGGWKRHIGRVSVLVQPTYRGRGLARRMIQEISDLARHAGLDSVEAEFIGKQEAAIKMFSIIGFAPLLNLPKYVRDMQANTHDYVVMNMELKTPEEYAGMG